MSDTFARYPSLKSKTVFITGGASGIGAEIVKAFAAQGAKVGFVDLDAKGAQALTDATEGTLAWEQADLRDIPALQAAFARSERLLRASEAGLRRFQLKLEALKHNQAFLRIYTQRGGRQDLPTFFRGKTDLEV